MADKQEMRRSNEELEGCVVERTRELAAALWRSNRFRQNLGVVFRSMRRSEDRLRLVIDTIPTMAWSLTPDGAVDFLNQRCLDYAGLSLEQYVKEPTHTIHPEDVANVLEKWRAAMAVGDPYDDEMRLRRHDGKYRWCMVRTDPLRDESGAIVKWYGVATDIDDRKRAEERLKATSEQLRALSASIQSAREQEGARIAREIHDELGSRLASVKWDLEGISKILVNSGDQRPVSELRRRVEAMIELMDATINITRRISSELRPSALDKLGLVAAIEWQAEQFQGRTGIVCRIESSSASDGLNQEQSTAVFRIFQEALTNVLRHARATHVDIRIRQEDSQLVLTVSDNGRGIAEIEKSDPSSLGLLGMKERAYLVGGTLDIARSEEGGTVITVTLPTARDGLSGK